ncbi:ParA family protein [Burkholderia pseudomallei]
MATTSYAIWNNKGGVGKSTITFHLASRYAEQHPEKTVLVIDLCPQANSSMMLLGGGTDGETHVLGLCTEPVPRTVVGYLSSVISGGALAALPDPGNFVIPVAIVNREMPGNLLLLSGDGNLEPMSPAITQAANAPALTPTVQPWRWIHLIFKGLIDSVAATLGERDLVVFIDTNPSFAIYTELAISAADRLVVPVNADDSSRVAANALFILLHGQTPPHPIYGAWTYAAQAQRFGINIPQIHVIVGNRLTQYEGAAGAFSALSDATADTLFHGYRVHPAYFTRRDITARTLEEFRTLYSIALRDFNTAGVVSAHLGRPLSRLNGGHHMVHGQRIQVNAERVGECEQAIDGLLAKL